MITFTCLIPCPALLPLSSCGDRSPVSPGSYIATCAERWTNQCKHHKLSVLGSKGMLKICADVEKFMASYHGAPVTPQAVVYFLSEVAVFAIALMQIISYTPPSLFTSRFLVCDAKAHNLPWPAPDLIEASTNISNSSSSSGLG